MNLQVVVEPAIGQGFVARAEPPFNWTAEGATEQEAVDKVRQKAAAAKVITLDLPADANPLTAIAGDMKDDPMWELWRRAIEENRRRDEAQPETPW